MNGGVRLDLKPRNRVLKMWNRKMNEFWLVNTVNREKRREEMQCNSSKIEMVGFKGIEICLCVVFSSREEER